MCTRTLIGFCMEAELHLIYDDEDREFPFRLTCGEHMWGHCSHSCKGCWGKYRTWEEVLDYLDSFAPMVQPEYRPGNTYHLLTQAMVFLAIRFKAI